MQKLKIMTNKIKQMKNRKQHNDRNVSFGVLTNRKRKIKKRDIPLSVGSAI